MLYHTKAGVWGLRRELRTGRLFRGVSTARFAIRVLRGVRQGAPVQGRPRQLYRSWGHQLLQERGAREPGHLRGRALLVLHRS